MNGPNTMRCMLYWSYGREAKKTREMGTGRLCSRGGGGEQESERWGHCGEGGLPDPKLEQDFEDEKRKRDGERGSDREKDGR